MTMRTALLNMLFLVSVMALCGVALTACEDDAGQDCELGTECPGGGCMDGICVTVCDDPCAGRDDLVCVIDHADQQMCVDVDRVNVDRNFVPVSGSDGTSNGTETGSGSDTGTGTSGEDTGSDVAAGG